MAAGLGLVLRLAWVHYATRAPLGLYDPARYAGYADRIAEGQGYSQFTSGDPTAYYPPGYPFFLAALRWFTDHDGLPVVAGTVQAVLGALTVVLAAVVAHRLGGARAAAVAAGVLALYPNLVFHTGALLSETLYNTLFLGALAALVWRPWAEGLSTGRLLGAAALFAGAVLVRPISLAVLPALAVAWWLHDHDVGRLARRVGLFAGVVALALAPWMVRNLVRIDALVLSTNTGDNLCIGHREGASGRFALAPACDTGESTADSAAAEVRHDRDLTDAALRYARRHPGEEARLVWRRAEAMFADDHDALPAVQSYGDDDFIPPSTEDRLEVVADLWWYGVAGLGVVGMAIFVVRRRPEGILVVLATVATLAVPLAFFGDPRFKVPAVPLLVVAASTVVAAAWDRLTPPRGRSAPSARARR